MDEQRHRDLMAVISAAQRVAGIASARNRGDHRGAKDLLATFESSEEVAGGALLATELLLKMLGDERNVHVEHVAQQLCADLEAAVGSRPSGRQSAGGGLES